MIRFVLAAAPCLLVPVLATQAAERPRHEQPSRWVTTVVPAGAPVNTGRNIETGALPPNKPVAAPVSLSRAVHGLEGLASFYWQEQKTANGERFDKMAMTAAHKTLPFGTKVRVTHLGNGKSVVVRINDRGPFKAGRVIDLSYAAAGVLGMHGQGLAKVKVEVVQ
ncbi:MAG: septal ring lytic transglycosylase RlpA family protein [Hyphomicrobiaceae bacterium]